MFYIIFIMPLTLTALSNSRMPTGQNLLVSYYHYGASYSNCLLKFFGLRHIIYCNTCISKYRTGFCMDVKTLVNVF